MHPSELLKEIMQAAEQKQVTRSEVMAAYDAGAGTHDGGISRRHVSLPDILYFLGGAIVFIGIVTLIAQNWETLNSMTKILATLGSGIAAYVVGVLLHHQPKTALVSQAFFLIAGLVFPVGIAVTFDIGGIAIDEYSVQSGMAALLLGIHILSYWLYRKNLFILFALLAGTWLYFSVTGFLFTRSGMVPWQHFEEYRILVAGLTYVALGYAFSERGVLRDFSDVLYGIGLFGFLGAALSLGGWSPNQNWFWELIFPGLVFGVIFLSMYLKSRPFLAVGSLYLMAYIIKITVEYFANSIGWPFALVLAGLGLIATGYFTFSIKKKYMK